MLSGLILFFNLFTHVSFSGHLGPLKTILPEDIHREMWGRIAFSKA